MEYTLECAGIGLITVTFVMVSRECTLTENEE